jgi:FkbM family methyltransferase
MKKTASAFIWLLSGIVGKKNLERASIYIAKSLGANLHEHGLLQIGASTNVYLDNGREFQFLAHTIAKLFASTKNPVFFDVGANIGDYTMSINKNIPHASIFSFEPVSATFEQLTKNVGDKAHLYNIGLGNTQGKGVIFNSANDTISEIATMYKDALVEVFNNTNEIATIEFDIDTVDNFCTANNVERIDFLKIDVEGNELAVLQGASKMLANDRIRVIQFEFNSHNVYSRVFLRDFYLLLKSFNFYRLAQSGLVSLGNYNSINEIFTFQNIIAIHKNLPLQLDKEYLS